MADDTEIEGSDLAAIIGDEIAQAQQYDGAELAEKRSYALEYLRGVMRDVPARVNGSKQTSRDFADTLSWVLPGIVRVFTASDQMVQYDKVKSENDDWALDATEYTNYTFFRENDGYRILYNGTYNSLALGNGLACSYYEPARIEAKTFSNKTEMELAMLLQEGWQPTGSIKPGTKPGQMEDPDTGEVIEVPTLTVKLQREKRKAKICDITCKPENLLLNSTATTIEDSRFCAYLHDDKTRSDLMEMAEDYDWDTEVIKNLPSFNLISNNEVSDARLSDRVVVSNSPVKSGDPIELFECYIHVDADGDGITELVQAWYAGRGGAGTLLGWDEWDGDIPYTDIPCYPVPHRWDAESLWDRTADIQRVKTMLLRGALDNTYWVNMPMREVEVGTVENPDILVSPKFGGIIWKKKGTGTSPIVPHTVPYTADKSLVALQYMDEMTAKRTGVSRSTMALDPEALQNQTATANQNNKDAAYSQIELIARNQAELGWTPFFAKRLRLAIKHKIVREIPSKRGEPGPVGPDGQPGPPSDFRQIDASQWDPSMAVTVNTGLGTGSRDRDLAMLRQVLEGQLLLADRFMAAGAIDDAIDMLPKIVETMTKMAESSGLHNPDSYYPEYTEEKVAALKEMAKAQKEQPSPQEKIEQAKLEGTKELKALELKAQGQVEQQKIMANGEAEKMKANGNYAKEMAQMQADERIENVKLNNQLTVEQIRANGDIELQREKLAFERYKVDTQATIEREKIAQSAVTADANNAARAEQARQAMQNKPSGGKPA